MSVRDELHRIVDQLPERELHAARRFLEYLCHVGAETLSAATRECPWCASAMEHVELEKLVRFENDVGVAKVRVDRCTRCREELLGADAVRHLERVRESMARQPVTAPVIGRVYDLREVDLS